MSAGFTLHYEGAKFGPTTTTMPSIEGENKTQTKTAKLGNKFGNMGALTIRYNLAHRQRAGLVQQISLQNYESNPIQKAAKGEEQKDLFEPENDPTPMCIATAKLGKAAHASFGETKILNNRAQPLAGINRAKQRGELDLWARIHAPVWHTGINLGATLSAQGFVYVCCPENISEKDRNDLNAAMVAGNFKVDGNEVVVLGRRLQTRQPKELYNNKKMIELNPKGTSQKNGLVISGAELGWMIHNDNPKIVPQDMVEDLVKLMRVAQGGFYELTEEQQDLVTGGRLKDTNGLGLFEQNQQFNAMFEICEHLEKEYGFDPEKLLGHALTTASSRVADFFKNHENVEDFLTGPLLTEMVQSLRITRAASTRKEFPIRFNNPFIVSDNNTKAVAHAFDANYNGMPLFKLESLEKDDRYKDILVKGELALPSLSYGKNAAAILSTAILVSEQMLLEQIFREAYVNGGEAGIADVLKQVLEGNEKVPKLVSKITQLIESANANEKGPILGLQFDYCDELVATIREAFNTNLLIDLVQKLEQEGILTDEALERFYKEHGKSEVQAAITILHRLGKLIQDNPATTAAKEGSAGINAGLNPLINKMFPETGAVQYFQVPGVTREDLDKKAAETAAATSTASKATTPAPAATNNKGGGLTHALNVLGGYALRTIETLAGNAPLIATAAFMSMLPRADAPSL